MSTAAALDLPNDFPRDIGIRLRQEDANRLFELAHRMDITNSILARMILAPALRRGIHLQVPQPDERTAGGMIRPTGRRSIYPATVTVRLAQDEANLLGATAGQCYLPPSTLGRLILIEALRAPEGIRFAQANAPASPPTNVHPIRPGISPSHAGQSSISPPVSAGP